MIKQTQFQRQLFTLSESKEFNNPTLNVILLRGKGHKAPCQYGSIHSIQNGMHLNFGQNLLMYYCP